MAVSYDQLSNMIQEAFPDAEFELLDTAGDGDHYELKITCSSFKGLSKISQHKLVYEKLPCVGTSLHALALKTFEK